MADITTTPATKITAPTWTFLTLARNLQIKEGALVPSITANLTVTRAEYLGDEAGVPLQAIQATPMAPGQGQIHSNVVLDLTEVVTRADGSQLTVLELLDAIGQAAAV